MQYHKKIFSIFFKLKTFVYIGKPQNSQASITPTAQTMNDKTKLTLPCGLLLVKISLFVFFSHQQPCPYTCQKMVTVKF